LRSRIAVITSSFGRFRTIPWLLREVRFADA